MSYPIRFSSSPFLAAVEKKAAFIKLTIFALTFIGATHRLQAIISFLTPHRLLLKKILGPLLSSFFQRKNRLTIDSKSKNKTLLDRELEDALERKRYFLFNLLMSYKHSKNLSPLWSFKGELEHLHPLFFAAFSSSIETIDWLAKRDVNLSEKLEGVSFLQIIILRGDLPFFETLLEKHYLTLSQKELFELFFFSIDFGKKEFIYFFVNQKKFPIDVLDTSKRNGLHRAAIVKSVPSIKALLSLGISCFKKDAYGRTPYFYLCHSKTKAEYSFIEEVILNSEKCPQILLEKTSSNPAGCELMLSMVLAENTRMIEWLAELGVPLERPVDKKKNTFLHLAALNGKEASFCLLLKLGAASDAKNKEGKTPYALASTPKIKTLLLNSILKMYGYSEKLASTLVNKRLVYVIKKGWINLVDPLLKIGFDDTSILYDGKTIYQVALDFNQFSLFYILRKNNISIHQRDAKGKTVVHSACRKRTIPSPLCLLAACGADLEIQDKEGVPPIWEAILSRNLEALNELIHLGVSPDPLDKKKRSPFLYCLIKGMRPFTERLLEVCDPNLAVLNGCSYLQIFCQLHGDISFVQRLIDRGADVNACSYAAPLPPLFAACKSGHTQAFRVLLDEPDLDLKQTVNGRFFFSYIKSDQEKKWIPFLLQLPLRHHEKILSTFPEFSNFFEGNCFFLWTIACKYSYYNDLLEKNSHEIEGKLLQWIVPAWEYLYSPSQFFKKAISLSPSFFQRAFEHLSPLIKSYFRNSLENHLRNVLLDSPLKNLSKKLKLQEIFKSKQEIIQIKNRAERYLRSISPWCSTLMQPLMPPPFFLHLEEKKKQVKKLLHKTEELLKISDIGKQEESEILDIFCYLADLNVGYNEPGEKDEKGNLLPNKPFDYQKLFGVPPESFYEKGLSDEVDLQRLIGVNKEGLHLMQKGRAFKKVEDLDSLFRWLESVADYKPEIEIWFTQILPKREKADFASLVDKYLQTLISKEKQRQIEAIRQFLSQSKRI